MKLRHIGQAALAGAVSLGIIIGIGACGPSTSIDYLYVTNAKTNPGQIDIYLVDHRSGTLSAIKESPVPTGANPQSIAATANGKYLYVANHDDNTVVEYAITSDDASLTQKNVYHPAGNSPTSLTIDSTGTYLFVTMAFQPQFDPTNAGPGALVIYPISQTDGSLGTPLSDTSNNGTPYYPTCNNPVGVTVLNNSPVLTSSSFSGAIYVVNDPASQPPRISATIASAGTAVDYSNSTANGCTATTGQLTGFQVKYSGSSTPTISSIAPVTGSPFAAGTAPDAITSDIQDRFVYVTDLVTNQLLGYIVSGPGILTPINNGPFATGNYPDAINIDPTNQYIFVANYRDATVSGYQITSNGVPSSLASGSGSTKTGPMFVYVEPSSGRYLYTANFLDNTVSGFGLNPNTGALSGVQNSPFPAAGQPTAMTAVTNGSHSIEVLPIY